MQFCADGESLRMKKKKKGKQDNVNTFHTSRQGIIEFASSDKEMIFSENGNRHEFNHLDDSEISEKCLLVNFR